MKNRIYQLRKALDYTQAEFGEKIGLSRDGIASYERGNAKPTGVAIQCMVSVFGVRREWLETGEGEMFTTDREDARIADSVKSSSALQSLVSTWSMLTDANKRTFEDFVAAYVAEYQQREAERIVAEGEAEIDGAIEAQPGETEGSKKTG